MSHHIIIQVDALFRHGCQSHRINLHNHHEKYFGKNLQPIYNDSSDGNIVGVDNHKQYSVVDTHQGYEVVDTRHNYQYDKSLLDLS